MLDWKFMGESLCELYNVQRWDKVDLHHLYSGQHIDTLITKGKLDKEILKGFRNSFLNLYPIDHNKHIAKENLPQINSEQFYSIIDFISSLEKKSVFLRLINDYSITEKTKIIHQFSDACFGEIISPYHLIKIRSCLC